jgi:hypothetical protein
MTTALILFPAPGLVPARLFAPTPKAARRVMEFFTAQIDNDHSAKPTSTPRAASPAGARPTASTS